ncbi:MAG: HAMP domain-containing protein [Acidobacteria bacterium]|nr:MAG: HAMP domain-containing protein [Acidobacteriota bacterium]
MRIATRLRLGYLALVGLVLVVAGGTALELHRFGQRLENELGQAYRGASTALAVLDDLEREHEAVEAALLGSGQASVEALADARAACDARLAELGSLASAPDEHEAVDHARRSLAEYRAEVDALFASVARPSVIDYEREALGSWDQARAAVRALLESKQRVMERAAAAARRDAWRRAAALALVVTAALVLFTGLSRSLERGVLEPLEDLRRTAEAVAAGDDHRRVIVAEDDELGLVGRQLNRLLDRQRQLLAESEARRTAERRLLLGLLEALAPGAGLLRLDGAVAVPPAGLDDASLVALGRQPAERFRDAEPGTLAGDELRIPVQDSRVARCRLLVTSEGAPAGWLVRVDGVDSAASPGASA